MTTGDIPLSNQWMHSPYLSYCTGGCKLTQGCNCTYRYYDPWRSPPNYPTNPAPEYPDPWIKDVGKVGWICPKCGIANNPENATCMACIETWTSTNTG